MAALEATPISPAEPGFGRLHAASYAGLLCVGVYATSFGPAMPFLARHFGVSLDHAGLLVTMLFVGSIVASGAMTVYFHRFEPRLLALVGLVVVAGGAMALALTSSWPLALLAVGILGIGDGLLVAAAHSAIASTASDVPRGLNRLNLWFAVGATLGPVWAGVILLNRGEHAVVYVGVAVICVAAAALLATVPRRPLTETAVHESPHLRSRAFWTMGAILFLYVGAEIGLGSWVASYSTEAFGAGVMTGALVTAGYWGALAIGRIISGALFGRGISPLAVLVASIAGALFTSASLALADGNLAVGVSAAFATGLCFGPIWPAAITLATRGAASGAPAAMVTIGNAGGILFPWLQGKVLVAAGPGRGVALTALLCLFMLVLLASHRQPRLIQQPAPGNSRPPSP
ncbi:MAG: MFS transporter [Tepidiformaceae bacterium]